MSAPFPFAGELSATLSSLLWAVAGVLFVRVGAGASGIAINLGKNLTGVGCFLLLLLLLGGSPWPAHMTTKGLVLLALSGVMGLTICDSLLFRSFLEIGPRRANLFMATTPLIVAGLSLPPPLGERLPATAWIGMGVCIAGITLAVLERTLNPVRQAQLRRGARDALLAALFQALGLLLARWGLREANVSVAEGATVRMVFGTAGMIVLGLSIGRLGSWTQQLRVEGAWRRVAVAAFLGTFLGIWTNQAGLAWARHTGVAATLNGLAPIFLIPLSAVFLAESHDWRAWLSTLLAVGGIALMTIA